MASERPPAKTVRPWYLVLALLICSGLGAYGSTDGWAIIEVYRGAAIDVPRDITREEDRKAVEAANGTVLAALDAERPRVFPLAVAELVLGMAMFIFAAAAMTGRGGARRVLLQLVIAQAVLVVAMYFLTPKLRWADMDVKVATTNARALARGEKPDTLEQQMPAVRVLYRGLVIAGLFVRSAVAGLIVLALTRPRARAFYDAQSERPSEG